MPINQTPNQTPTTLTEYLKVYFSANPFRKIGWGAVFLLWTMFFVMTFFFMKLVALICFLACTLVAIFIASMIISDTIETEKRRNERWRL